MTEKKIKILETIINAEDTGINFFSKSARRFFRYQELKMYFEVLAKSKVANKQLFQELLSMVKNQSISIKGGIIDSYDFKNLEKITDDAAIVGDHSLPEDILKVAFLYLRETIKAYSVFISVAGYESRIEKMISESKLVLELVKKHIHLFTEEIQFYGYE